MKGPSRTPKALLPFLHAGPEPRKGSTGRKVKVIDLRGIGVLIEVLLGEQHRTTFENGYAFVDSPASGAGDKRARVDGSAVASVATGDMTRWVGALRAASACIGALARRSR